MVGVEGQSADVISDAELTALALAADTEAELADDAVSIFTVIGPDEPGPLPSWYMPAPLHRPRFSGWRKHLVTCGACSVIASFLTITAAGLCNTYGQLHF